jgi:hypothetical protein
MTTLRQADPLPWVLCVLTVTTGLVDAVSVLGLGPTEGKLRCNPAGCWREVSIAVFPFRTGTSARK